MKGSEAYIRAISYYLPKDIVTNEDVARQFPEWSAEKVATKVGIFCRHHSSEGETSSDMAYMAAEKLFSEHSINRTDIDFIILCTQSPDYFLPTSACILQNRLGLNKETGAFDLNLGCSGFVYCLAVAKGLIFAGVAQNVLLLTAETYSKYLHPQDKGNLTLFGDAAAATLISSEGKGRIDEFSLGTDGSGYDKLIVRNGASRNRKLDNVITRDEEGNLIAPDNLFMNGAGIFSFTMKWVPKLVEDLLIKNKMAKEDIDLFVFHQANKFMLESLVKKIKIDPEKFFYYLKDVGNTVSSTIPIALCEAEKAGKIKIESKVMLAGFGVGLSWAGVVLQF